MPEDVENLILTNFNVMMNMKVEEDTDLQKIKKENEIRRREEEVRRIKMEKEERGNRECEQAPRRLMKKMEIPMASPRPLPKAMVNNMRMMKSNSIPMKKIGGLMGIPRPQMMMAANHINCAPQMDSIKCFTSTTRNLTQADFLMQDRSRNVKEAFERAEKEMGMEFEKPGLAKEYKERHYYIKEHKNSKSNAIQNPIWLDFVEHIIKNKKSENFLSKYVLYNKIDFNEFLMILSII